MSLAIAFYFSSKKSKIEMAKNKIALLASRIVITKTGETTVKQTITNKKIYDFEDGLEYYSALDAGCKVIITEDGIWLHRYRAYST